MPEGWVSLIVALMLGIAIGWFLYVPRSRAALAAAESRMAALQEQYTAQSAELSDLKAKHQQAAESLRSETERRAAAEQQASRIPELERTVEQHLRTAAELQARLASLQAAEEERRKATEEKLSLIDDARAKLLEAFKALSADALRNNSQSFLQLAKTALEKFQEGAKGDLEARQKAVHDLVQPLRESLQKVDDKLGELEKARVSAYSALQEQLKALVETHLPTLRSETANLVKALRQPTVRGRWGEIQLKRVVEMAGMLEHCDFVTQENRTTEDGRLRPDLVVRLPGGKQIVVDAKAPLDAYLNAIECDDEEAQRAFLATHARQVRAHMSALGRKAYFEQFDPSPDFVVLFLPGEVFFSAALQQDPDLIEFGIAERVIPATPTTLVAMLRAIAYGWQQEALARNAQEIAALGRQLHERVVTLADRWSELGSRLGKAVEAYNKATVTLESRVLVSARRFSNLKAAREDTQIATPGLIEVIPRALQAPEMAATEGDNDEV